MQVSAFLDVAVTLLSAYVLLSLLCTTLSEFITMERIYNATPARVFAAWSNAKARERWGRPNDEEIIVYDQADFRVGGEDVSRCGPKGGQPLGRWWSRHCCCRSPGHSGSVPCQSAAVER